MQASAKFAAGHPAIHTGRKYAKRITFVGSAGEASTRYLTLCSFAQTTIVPYIAVMPRSTLGAMRFLSRIWRSRLSGCGTPLRRTEFGCEIGHYHACTRSDAVKPRPCRWLSKKKSVRLGAM